MHTESVLIFYMVALWDALLSTLHTFVFHISFDHLSFQRALHHTQSPPPPSSGLQQSLTVALLVSTAWGFAGEQKRERNEGRIQEHGQVSDICADSAPALSSDPDNMVPGRD